MAMSHLRCCEECHPQPPGGHDARASGPAEAHVIPAGLLHVPGLVEVAKIDEVLRLHRACEAVEVELAELVPVRRENEDVGASRAGVDVVGELERGHFLPRVVHRGRVIGHDVGAARLEVGREPQARALADVVRLRLEGDPEHGDPLAREVRAHGRDLLYHARLDVVVDGEDSLHDLERVADLARKVGYTFEIMEADLSVNDHVKARMVEKVAAVCPDLPGKRVAMLGIAFKPETDDIRESACLRLASDLQARGADVVAYDPAAMDNARKEMPSLKLADDVYSCAAGADVLVLATDWNQFRKLDLDRLEKTMKAKNFVDLRNLYEPKEMRKAGWNYAGLGRA